MIPDVGPSEVTPVALAAEPRRPLHELVRVVATRRSPQLAPRPFTPGLEARAGNTWVNAAESQPPFHPLQIPATEMGYHLRFQQQK